MSETVRMYCPSCGEEVDTFVMLDGDEEALCCFNCGMNLSKKTQMKSLDMMLIAEDSLVFREVLKDKIIETGMSRDVEMAGSGEEFIELFTRMIAGKKPISLAVLDIRMPGMNGINAAMSLRAIERGLGIKRKVPVLFFSSVKCDDTLRKVFEQVAPARYINKGNSNSPDELSDRLVEVIGRLLNESKT